ncbi:MAG: hypothetical protein JOY86_06040 [Candidatus Eremiobacteraeota bacterium]|nr:hypothetical protein [Candidatus Eremiobacteraeota bacterium]
MKRPRSTFPLSYERADGFIRRGTVRGAASDFARLAGPGLSPGEVAFIADQRGSRQIAVHVARVDLEGAHCAPLEDMAYVCAGDAYACAGATLGAYVGDALLGRVLDAWGRTLQGTRVPGALVSPLPSMPLSADVRAPITHVLPTGVSAIDAFATLGHGQRISLTAGAGVGKTTLLRRIVERAGVDARVVALVGERGREIEEAVRCLRTQPAWSTTSLYCASSDTRPLERYGAARSATAQAEWLCREGRRVLLVIDSLTRAALAWREIALTNGEPPAARGHPPSLHGALASLVERAGARRDGAMTAIYTVLAEGDDPNEPVAESVRAMLDGHIALARRHAEAGRYPAVDVLRSLSRTMSEIVSPAQREDASLVRRALATLEDAADLLAIGAYRTGSDPWLDACVALRGQIDGLVFDGERGCDDPVTRLGEVAGQLRRSPGRPAGGA